MIDLASKIEQRGSVYFWKYKTDGWLGSEWHFRADSPGRKFFLGLLDVMALSENPCRYGLRVTPVTQKVLRIADCDLPFENRTGLKLTYRPFDQNHDEWFVHDNEQVVDISFGKAMLKEWRRAVVEASGGGSDNLIGLNEDHAVLIW